MLDPDQHDQQDQVTSYHSSPPKWGGIADTINFPDLPPLKKIAANKHVFAKLPLVTSVISNLTRLTAVVCMKVRFEPKVTRSFSLSPRRFATRCRSFAARSLFHEEKFREKPLGPGYWFAVL